jgi:hypothetical protein
LNGSLKYGLKRADDCVNRTESGDEQTCHGEKYLPFDNADNAANYTAEKPESEDCQANGAAKGDFYGG